MTQKRPDLIGWHVDAVPCYRSELDGADCYREHVTDLRPFLELGTASISQTATIYGPHDFKPDREASDYPERCLVCGRLAGWHVTITPLG